MDDPWGSPWATNDNLTLEPPPRASTTLEPPGRSVTRQRSFTNISPWATIEEDGDWGATDPGLGLALPPTAATNGGGSVAWSAWGGENGFNASQTNLTTRAREGSLGLSSPAWPGAASPNPNQGKTLSRRSSDRSLVRQPSPDPWAAEFSQNRLSLPAAVHISAEQTAFSTLDRHHEEDEKEQSQDHDRSKDNQAGLAPESEAENARALEATPVPMKDQGANVNPDTAPDEKVAEQAPDDDDQADSPSASRHSSMSNESRREERPDSPITSMDEDSKEHHAIPRRPSAKVHELVEMFDGIAKRKDSLLVPDAISGRQRSGSRSVSLRSARTDDASDFGDFEDAEEFVPSRHPSVSGSPRPSSSRGPRPRSLSKTSLRNAAQVTTTVTSPIPEEASNKFQDLRMKFGPVKFSTDLELVNKLFDVARLDAEQPPAKDYSLDAIDGIIKDSFTTTSERKVWYRISRPGTMRRHDMGDDDNYRRVTWAGSTVRKDAAKIVCRWMEEDTYTGRPAMGGGSVVKGGGFNWDSKAETREPISFDRIFGKRKSAEPPKAPTAQTHRPLSLQPTGASHSRNSSVGVKSLPPRSPLSIPAPPAGPAFGWSTGATGNITPISSQPSGQFVRQSMDVNSGSSENSRVPSIHEPESRNSIQLMPPPPAPSQGPLKVKTAVQAVQDEDDDEDWGEMVASPADSIRPVSALFDSSINGSMANFSSASPAPPPAPNPDIGTTLNAVSTKLENTQAVAKAGDQGPLNAVDAAAPTSIWDFSAFDSGPAAFALPPTTTSKPEFDFDTPLQSPTPTIPSRTGSPVSLHVAKSPTPVVLSRTGSPLSFQSPKPPTTPAPFRPHHAPHSSLGSISRPSPLHHVITSKPSSPTTASPIAPPPRASSLTTASPINPPPKTVAFAEDGDASEIAAARAIVHGLPDLTYMLR